MRDTMEDFGFHLQLPLCNQCIHRRQDLLSEETDLSCRILGEIPEDLLTCRIDECESFEQDEEQARLFEGLL